MRSHEECLHPTRETQVGPARYDRVRNLQIDECSRRWRCVRVPARGVDKEYARCDFAGQCVPGGAAAAAAALQDWDLR